MTPPSEDVFVNHHKFHGQESRDKGRKVFGQKTDRVETAANIECYEFGRFRIDVRNRLLLCHGATVELTLKEFELLEFFVRHTGAVVDKNRLLEAVWEDVYIEEATLTRTISRLRKKLETASPGETLIETLPKRGYRFLPAVAVIGADPPALVVEETTVTRVRFEDSLVIPDERVSSRPVLPAGRPRKLPFMIAGAFAVTLLLVILYFVVLKRSDSGPAPVIARRVVPFSGLPGRENLPAFSGDGKRLVFSWNGGDGVFSDVYVRSIDGGEPLRLTKGAADSLYPVFTPDGNSVAFSRSGVETSEIFLVPVLGGGERKIAEVRSGGSSFSFTPDGRALVVPNRETESATTGIFVISLPDGQMRRITTPPDGLIDGTPRVSPDGRRVAFLRAVNSGIKDIFVASIDGGDVRQLTNSRSNIAGLAWMPDGERLVFSSPLGASAANLWQIDATGGEPRLIVTGGRNPSNPAVSPDGRTVAFAEEFEDINIWRYDTQKNGEPARKFIASTRNDHSQQFSPDGRRLVFASSRTGAAEIWTANADGSVPTQLTQLGNAGSPRFSPDGRQIAFSNNIDGKGEIYVINSDGSGGPRRLTENPAHDVFPAWSADGRSLFFCSDRSGAYQLWKVESTGGEPVRITENGGFESFATPDGKKVIYSKERGVAGLWTVSAGGGGGEQPMSDLSDAGYWRSWTLVGENIYYVAYSASAPFALRRFDLATKQSSTVLSFDEAPSWIYAGLAATPDGRGVLYAQRNQSASSISLADVTP